MRRSLERKLGCGVSAFFLLLCGSARANELAGLSLEELSNVKVTSAVKSAQPVSDAPATIYVFSDKDIAAHGYRNLTQLLADIPEIEINARGIAETYNLVTIRGVAGINKNILILQDGIRIAAITGSQTPMQYNFPLYQAKRVEVVLGPASALYGADAQMGVVNIITKDAGDLNGGQLTASGGRFSTTDNSVIYGNTYGDIDLVFGGSQYYSAEPFFPEFYPDLYGGYYTYQQTGTVQGLSGPMTIPIEPWNAPTSAYTVFGKASVNDFEFGYWRSFSSVSSANGGRPDYNLSVSEDKIAATIETLYGRYRYTTPDEKWNFKTEISKGSQTMEPSTLYRDQFSDFQDAYKFEEDKSVNVEEEVSYELSEDSSLIGGFIYQDFSAIPKTADLPQPYNPNVGTGSQGYTFPGTTIPIPFYAIFYQNLGPYAQYRARLSDETELTAGVRYDYNTRFGGTTNPRVGVVIAPNRQLKIKLLYDEAYEAPSPYVEYQTFGSFTFTGSQPTGGNFTVPNPGLGPEKVRSAETNVSYHFTDDLALSGDAFMDRIWGVIEETPLPSGYIFEGVPITGFQPTNLSHLVSYGGTLRFDATIRPRAFYLKPFLAYSFIGGNLDGDVLPNAARNTVKSGIDIDHGKLSLYPRFEFRSQSWVLGTNTYAPTYWVMNIAARYDNVLNTEKFPIAIFVDVWNLLDRRYANSNQFDSIDFGATPQDPIRFLAGATLSF